MKKILIIAICSTLLFGCRKTADENPKPDIDFGAWANTGNIIFDPDMPNTGDSTFSTGSQSNICIK
jgi:hypothetical protein